MVRSRGLEPPRVAPLAPQASASTNSATTADGGEREPAKPRVDATALDVTNRSRRNKARARLRLFRRPMPASAHIREPRQQLLDLDRNAVSTHDDTALG